MRGAPGGTPHGLTAGLYRATVTKVKAGRIWVTIPDVFGKQELGGKVGFQYLDSTGETSGAQSLGLLKYQTELGEAPGAYDGAPLHRHNVLRTGYKAGDRVLVASVAGRVVDLVVLGLLKP